jgi:hypothetical protein
LSGGSGADILRGGAGDDYLHDGSASVVGDIYDGGAGTDILWADGNLSFVTIIGVEVLQLGRAQLMAEQLCQFDSVFAKEITILNGGRVDLTGSHCRDGR